MEESPKEYRDGTRAAQDRTSQYRAKNMTLTNQTLNPIPIIPESAPFSPDQRAWLNGYLVGLLSNAHQTGSVTSAPTAQELESVLILYGSQTGSAEQLAKKTAKGAAKENFSARVLEMSAFNKVDWSKEKSILVVTSTWGDGDPPDNAMAFWNYLSSDQAPRLDHIRFAVLALGDSSYPNFCGAGKKFDDRLAQLGAQRAQERIDCDTDYDEPFSRWSASIFSSLRSVEKPESAPSEKIQSPRSPQPPAPTGPLYSRNHPYSARFLKSINLNTEGSSKETRHVEIALEDPQITYEPGDALGVFPANPLPDIEAILNRTGWDRNTSVTLGKQSCTLLEALESHVSILGPVPPSLAQKILSLAAGDPLKSLSKEENKASLTEFLKGRELLDLLELVPVHLDAVEICGLLRPLQPRLYSIASSPRMHPGEVHLTVGVVRYETHGRQRQGVCSTFLAERVSPNGLVRVFVQPSKHFKVPNDSRPMIMVGPGTGIAPFRSFLEERNVSGSTGKNWLFFGDQHALSDFLYRDELENLQRSGTLHRLSTAFSRDQTEKIYVQQRMIEEALDLWKWLEEGANFYVCGDAKRMAPDVDQALHQAIELASGKDKDFAADYVQKMREEKRYLKDVY